MSVRRRAAGAGAARPAELAEGLAVLHLFGRLRPGRARPLGEAVAAAEGEGVEALCFSVLGHKARAGVMLRHRDLWALRRAQAGLEAAGLELDWSFLSMTEVSEYARGLPDEARRHRLYPSLPPAGASVVAFYPMSKRRLGPENWYRLDFDERSRLMHEHGSHGRRHAGRVVQLVTAATGLDDWEWGVTLFAEDLAAVKDVVYQLRYDEASAVYGEFGPFVVGLICSPEELELGAGREDG